ncbi:MAG: succinate dehydrogenase cytochrome b subunit [Sandaracinaceae bacterium]
MQRALTLTRSTVGMKAVIAVTGLILFGFVIGHLAGNTLLFAGYEAFNGYAASLKGNPALLWGVRSVLLVSVVAHIALTMKLAGRNSSARPTAYKKARQDQITTYAARTMVISGPLLFAYILFHLAHFTVPGLDLGGEHDVVNVYGNVVRGFRVPWVAGIYIFANILLGLHLFHGAWSALQSLGANHPKYNPLRKRLAIGFALVVAGGNIFIPVAVMTRVVGDDEQLAASDMHPLGAPEPQDPPLPAAD